MEALFASFAAHLPGVIQAAIILIAGWFIAMLVSSLVKGVLDSTSLDEKLSGMLGGKGGSGIELGGLLGPAVFWIIMAFVLMAFFEAIGLTVVTEPLSALFNQVFEYAPRLLAGGGLLLAAFIIATILKAVLQKTFDAIDLDGKLGGQLGAEDGKAMPISKSLIETAYWLVFLLFLPAALEAIGMTTILDPINAMFEKVMAYIPNIISAGVLLAVGWFVARIVQRILTNLLAASGVDSLAAKFGCDQVCGNKKVSGIVGLLAYVFILVPIVISALQALQIEAISAPAVNMLNMIMTSIPMVLGAMIILTVATVVASFVSELVTSLLSGVGFDHVLAKLGLPEVASEGKKTPSQIAGVLVKVTLILFGVMEALNMLGFASLNGFVNEFLALGGQIVLGLVVLAIGLMLANFVAGIIQQSGTAQAKLLSSVARFAIIFLAGSMALREMGLANDIINMAFGLLLGGFALAASIAFGVGCKDIAAREMDSWVEQLKS